MKPTQLLAEMYTLLPDDEVAKPSIVIRELFLRQLPSDVRAHLTNKAALSLDELATEADNFFTTAGQRVSAVRSKTSNRPSPSSDSKLCYFHERFGDNARKCRAPCSFVPGN